MCIAHKLGAKTGRENYSERECNCWTKFISSIKPSFEVEKRQLPLILKTGDMVNANSYLKSEPLEGSSF